MSADAFETSAAAYVLGALSPADRAVFVQHLPACASCRERVDEVAGLPGLLSRVGVDEVTAMDGATHAIPPLPASLLPDLLRAIDHRRRRRRWVGAALVLVAASAVLLAALGPLRSTPAPTAQAMRPVITVPIAASVAVASVPWGTRVALRCTYAGSGAGRPYALVVIGTDGRRQSIGTWTAVPGAEVRLSAATSLRQGEIAAVEVQSLTGMPLLRLDHPGAS